MKRIIGVTLIGFILMIVMTVFPLTSFASSFDVSRATAYMKSSFTCGCSIEGTGAMTGRYGLITAAHNLYCQYHGEPLKEREGKRWKLFATCSEWNSDGNGSSFGRIFCRGLRNAAC